MLDTGAYWLMWSLRRLMPARSSWRVAQFDTLRLRLLKIAAQVRPPPEFALTRAASAPLCRAAMPPRGPKSSRLMRQTSIISWIMVAH
ncbi:MAG: hypothetical protein EBY30_16585 [Rhodospirillales bacterium]|nr:hypothetical protein [Rhodospirillales bacterium]